MPQPDLSPAGKQNSSTLTALADPVEVIEVTADVIPEPAATSVQHDAVLLAVVVVRLVLAPGWPLHDLACNRVALYLDILTKRVHVRYAWLFPVERRGIYNDTLIRIIIYNLTINLKSTTNGIIYTYLLKPYFYTSSD